MLKKIRWGLTGMLVCTMSVAAHITPTHAPQEAKTGAIITVPSNLVATDCDFKQQIVNLGYDKENNVMSACVKKKTA